jgi:transcriptional regulator with XRE-family HTH domain
MKMTIDQKIEQKRREQLVSYDEVSVTRAMEGDRSVPLTRSDFAEATRRLVAQGKSVTQIANLLGTTPRTVRRWKNGVHSPIARPKPIKDGEANSLLRRAEKSDSKHTRESAERIKLALARLRDLLEQERKK